MPDGGTPDAQQPGDEEQGDRVKRNRCCGKSQLTEAQILKQELGGSKREGGPGQPDQFFSFPERATPGEGERDCANREGADDRDVLDSWRCNGCSEPYGEPDEKHN